MDKISKASVNYGPPPPGSNKRCGNCVMYRKATALEGHCTLVAGRIKAELYCDEWEPRK